MMWRIYCLLGQKVTVTVTTILNHDDVCWKWGHLVVFLLLEFGIYMEKVPIISRSSWNSSLWTKKTYVSQLLFHTTVSQWKSPYSSCHCQLADLFTKATTTVANSCLTNWRYGHLHINASGSVNHLTGSPVEHHIQKDYSLLYTNRTPCIIS